MANNSLLHDVVKDVTRRDGSVLVKLEGERDMLCLTELRGDLLGLLQDEPGELIVDMSAVGFMNSAGLAMLVEILKKVRGYGGQMKLVGLDKRVRSVFEISRLVDVFNICEAEASA